MRFVSTRGGSAVSSISQAIRNGAAPDGGLYMPEGLTPLEPLPLGLPLPKLGAALLRPFFRDDPLADQLENICAEAFDFPVPLVTPDPARPGLKALELFHGPTGAFKDFGARFLMACFDRIASRAQPLKVLAATSGDTGGAVGGAAEGRDSVAAFILFPRGRVSRFQEQQLSCWGSPVRTLQVDGDFDDCQRLVKAAFADRRLCDVHNLTSANSINLGRLLPQMVYLASAALELFEKTGEKPGFIIPTGNLGHGFAAVLARRLGVPIGPIVAATNANRALFDWRRGGAYQPALAIRTIANAMDVGAPSNFERLAHLPYPRGEIEVERVSDRAIRNRIEQDYRRSGYVWCPHSATAAEAFERLGSARQAERAWVVAATAHPFKFADVVEPLIGAALSPPPPLADICDRVAESVRIPARIEALAAELGRPLQPALRVDAA
jgi:threonine synthase